MATLITKNSSTASSIPTAAQLVQGELAVNVTDKRLFTENSAGAVVELGTNPSSVTTGNAAYTGTLTGGTGVVNLGSGQVYKDASGNVGIGTSSPGYKLSVHTTTGGGFNMTNGVDSTLRVLVPSVGITYDNVNGGYHAWQISGTERVRLDSNGNVGIGTNSPIVKLDVNGKARLGSNFNTDSDSATILDGGTFVLASAGTQAYKTQFEIDASTTYINSNQYYSSGWQVYDSTKAPAGIWLTSNSGDSYITLRTSNVNSGVSTERARIDSAGNLGIGTSSPGDSNKLTVDGGRLVVSNGPVGASNTSTVKGVQTYFDATNNIGYIYSTQSGVANYRLSLNGSDIDFKGQMRLDSSGNLLVGTTSSSGRITVRASSSTDYAIATSVPNNNGYHIRFLQDTGGQVGSIQSTGSTTSYFTNSDYRLKNTIAPLTGALAKVAALRPCTYKWNVDGSDGQGFIAHELQAVEPGCVSGEKDETETRTVETSPAIPAVLNEDGVETSPAVAAVTEEQVVPKYQGIDTSFLVATLAAAIQELKAIVDAQAVKIAALEAK
jgi:hypothetical protein